jgi:hypothetical protein
MCHFLAWFPKCCVAPETGFRLTICNLIYHAGEIVAFASRTSSQEETITFCCFPLHILLAVDWTSDEILVLEAIPACNHKNSKLIAKKSTISMLILKPNELQNSRNRAADCFVHLPMLIAARLQYSHYH